MAPTSRPGRAQRRKEVGSALCQGTTRVSAPSSTCPLARVRTACKARPHPPALEPASATGVLVHPGTQPHLPGHRCPGRARARGAEGTPWTGQDTGKGSNIWSPGSPRFSSPPPPAPCGCLGCGALGEIMGRFVGTGRHQAGPGQGWEATQSPWGAQPRSSQGPGDSPSSRRRLCACRSRPGSRRGRVWGRQNTHRPRVVRSGGRPDSPGAESLGQGRPSG